ncbi:MAG TPA: hypothetical protein VFJ82_06680 [Longimicrobium sp.]|nr:hypothetical protein [Longimicrobium sp.]
MRQEITIWRRIGTVVLKRCGVNHFISGIVSLINKGSFPSPGMISKDDADPERKSIAP